MLKRVMVPFQTFPLREVIGRNEKKSKAFFSKQEKKIMRQEKDGSDFVTLVLQGLRLVHRSTDQNPDRRNLKGKMKKLLTLNNLC